jgi:hypothetical protein
VVSAGGLVRPYTLRMFNRFVRECKSGCDVWSQLSAGLVHIFLGENLATALVPQVNAVSAVIANTNFVAGDYDERTGLNGNGSTKWLNTGLVLSNAVGSMGAYLLSNPSGLGATQTLIGCRNAATTQRFRIVYLDSPQQIFSAWGGTGGGTATADIEAIQIGLWGATRDSATAVRGYRNGTAVGTVGATSVTPATSTNSLAVFMDHGGTNVNFLNGKLGGYFVINSVLSSNQWALLGAAWNRLNYALGRPITL